MDIPRDGANTGGSRNEQQAILQASLQTARSGFESAQSTAVNTLLSAFASVDGAVRGTSDPMFTNPDSANPRFNVVIPDSQLNSNIGNARVALGPILDRQAAASKNISVNSNLLQEIEKAEIEVRAARSFFDQLIRALNNAIPTGNITEAQIAAYQASATGARTALNGSLSSLSAAKENLSARSQGVTIAEKNVELGVTGGQPEDIAAAQAGVKQAQGALAAARANYEKTVIRAPISGSINSLSLKRGDYVQMSTPVMTVANNGALEIVTYVTENDARDIAAGSKVSIEGGASGVITHIAPALDPLTKKIEVRIGVSGSTKEILNGQSVLVSVTRANATIASNIKKITIPISAIKIGSSETVVFTLGADNRLVANPVVVGTLLGDRVVITEGLTGDMMIVTDARGLQAGEVVVREGDTVPATTE